jgi:hypothetical protein
LNRGLGIPVMAVDEDKLKEDEGFNYFDRMISILSGDGYSKPSTDCIVIDEISMINGKMWSLLLYIKRRIPRIKFILCGDIKRQLPPVGEEYRNFYNSYCIKELSSFFKIKLEYNFRTGMNGDVLWDNWSKHPERFRGGKQTTTLINVSYTNITRKKVINLIQDKLEDFHKSLGGSIKVLSWDDFMDKRTDYIDDKDKQTDTLKLSFGTPLIANKSVKEIGIAKNEIFKVGKIGENEVELEGEGKTLSYTYKDLFFDFYSAYCITIHKSQGETFKDEYTIWDWGKIPLNYFGRRLRYTAQSRSTNPEKNIVYKI